MVALMGFHCSFYCKDPYKTAWLQPSLYPMKEIQNSHRMKQQAQIGGVEERKCERKILHVMVCFHTTFPPKPTTSVTGRGCKDVDIIISTNKIIFTHWQSILISYRFWAFILFSWLLLSISETSTVTSCESVFCDESGGAALRRSELFRVNCIASGISSGSVVYSSCTWRSVRDRTAWKKKNQNSRKLNWIKVDRPISSQTDKLFCLWNC